MTSSESVINKSKPLEKKSLRTSETDSRQIAKKSSTNQLILSNKFITHHAKSGLNPLADAAAYLFSIIGKLKQLKSYRHLNKLQKELIEEINQFQEIAKSHGYSSEYILVSRYALCATLDDLISNTIWGGQGQWDAFNLNSVFNQEAANNERFFIILERIIKDPVQYIDVMELMYICLSLGFKGSYRSTEFGISQLEQIISALYKRIRNHRGDYNKTLAPYHIKTKPPSEPASQALPLWAIILITLSIILVIFLGLGYLLDAISNQAYQELVHIGNTLLYEATH